MRGFIRPKESKMRGTDYRIGGKTLWEMDAPHLMERDVLCFGGETSCHSLAQSMVRGNFGGVPIVDEQKRLIGMVTEFDLLNALKNGRDLKETSASEIMSVPISIPVETSAREVIDLLQSRHFSRVPVVDREGRLVGIVARRDLLAGYLESTMGPLPGF